VSNIKKVIDGIADYYENALRMPVTASNFNLPDAPLIGKDLNEKELGRLMQLILVAAINCDNKEKHIATILTLGTETQLIVKNAIEDLFITFGADGGRGRSVTMDSIGSMTLPDLTVPEGAGSQFKNEVKRLSDELAAAVEVKERTIQEMFDLKRELSSLQQENVQLTVENENLTDLVTKLQSTPSKTVPSTAGSDILTGDSSETSLKEAHLNKLQTRIETLREELFKTENSREEVKIKNELLEKELMELKFKNEELQRKANEARNLKDELDIHRQASEKAEKYEQMIEVYKKKLEEAAEFKRKMKSGADRSASQSSFQSSLEEEHRKNSNLKAQIESLKKQVINHPPHNFAVKFLPLTNS
jgi:protein HOOK1